MRSLCHPDGGSTSPRCSQGRIPKEETSSSYLRLAGVLCVMSPISPPSPRRDTRHKDMINIITRWISRGMCRVCGSQLSLKCPLSRAFPLPFGPFVIFLHGFNLLSRTIIITKPHITDRMAFLKALAAAVALLSAVDGAAM